MQFLWFLPYSDAIATDSGVIHIEDRGKVGAGLVEYLLTLILTIAVISAD